MNTYDAANLQGLCEVVIYRLLTLVIGYLRDIRGKRCDAHPHFLLL